jgi:hypothetical protein
MLSIFTNKEKSVLEWNLHRTFLMRSTVRSRIHGDGRKSLPGFEGVKPSGFHTVFFLASNPLSSFSYLR